MGKLIDSFSLWLNSLRFYQILLIGFTLICVTVFGLVSGNIYLQVTGNILLLSWALCLVFLFQTKVKEKDFDTMMDEAIKEDQGGF